MNFQDWIIEKFHTVVIPISNFLLKALFRLIIIKVTLLLLSLWLTIMYLRQFRSFDYFILSDGSWATALMTALMMLFFTLFGIITFLPGIFAGIEKATKPFTGITLFDIEGGWLKKIKIQWPFWFSYLFLISGLILTINNSQIQCKKLFYIASIACGLFVYASLNWSFKNFVAVGLGVSAFFIILSNSFIPEYSRILSMFGLGGNIKVSVVTVEGKRIIGGKLILRTPQVVYLSTSEITYEGDTDTTKKEKTVVHLLTEGNRIVLE